MKPLKGPTILAQTGIPKINGLYTPQSSRTGTSPVVAVLFYRNYTPFEESTSLQRDTVSIF